MYAQDDGGRELVAEYSVERDGNVLALVLESASGGRSAKGRNPDYNEALELLLGRLGNLGSTLTDALVDSQQTQQRALPEAERRIAPSPIALAGVDDTKRLRRDFCSRAARVGQAPGATREGSYTKRIRLRLEVPGFGSGDATSLAEVLAHQVFPRDEELEAARAEFGERGETVAPASGYDARKLIEQKVFIRQGQPRFRNALIAAYRGRCAVTGCSVTPVLEAAHLHPYRGPDTNDVTNGLLLRADIHTLRDVKLLAPEPDTREIVVSKHLAGTPYRELAGRPLTEPARPTQRPAEWALQLVWDEFQRVEKKR